MDASSGLNNLASGEALPQIAEKVGLLLDVAFAKKRGNSPGGLLSMVEGNAWEHVVNNVVLNNAVEDVTANEAKIAVHSGGCTLDESPVVSLVVRSLGVSVVKWFIQR